MIYIAISYAIMYMSVCMVNTFDSLTIYNTLVIAITKLDSYSKYALG